MSKQETYLSKRTRRGVLVLVIVCLIIIYTPRIFLWLNPKEKMMLSYTEILQTEKLTSVKERMASARLPKYSKKKVFKRPPKRFNPNEYSSKDWIDLGLSEKQANVILKFTKRGIYSNEDLQKIFVISEPLLLLIKDSAYYPEKPKYNKDYGNTRFTSQFEDKDQEKFVLIELNTASIEELESAPGIGPFFAKMIIKKRTELGGFNTKEQLMEVYKMEKIKFDEIEKFLRINPEIIIRLNINTATVEQLYKHPYVDYKVANSIVKMREQKGAYKLIEELKESLLIDWELFLKLKPYVYL
jgi:competence protein ComEA